MNEEEVLAVLLTAYSHDGRHDTTSELNLAAWVETATRAGWTLAEAMDVVHAHYAEHDTFLSPALITQAVRARRQAARNLRRRTEQIQARKALAPRGSAGIEHRRRVQAALARRLGWRRRSDSFALQRDCPWNGCGAPPGDPCTQPGPGGRRVPCAPHPSRLAGLDDPITTTEGA